MHRHIDKEMLFVILVLLAGALARPAGAADPDRLQRHRAGIWSLTGTAHGNRWIVIHNLEEAAGTGIYHIEVLGRKKGEPTWKVDRIVPHLAITEQALDKSVRKPLSKGAVYPEAFDDAFLEWKEEDKNGTAFVCETSVLECMK